MIPLGFCLFYALLRMTIPPRLLSAYVVFCIVVAILSKYQLLPNSWQVHFREEAIIRQLVPLFGFFSVDNYQLTFSAPTIDQKVPSSSPTPGASSTIVASSGCSSTAWASVARSLTHE